MHRLLRPQHQLGSPGGAHQARPRHQEGARGGEDGPMQRSPAEHGTHLILCLPCRSACPPARRRSRAARPAARPTASARTRRCRRPPVPRQGALAPLPPPPPRACSRSSTASGGATGEAEAALTPEEVACRGDSTTWRHRAAADQNALRGTPARLVNCLAAVAHLPVFRPLFDPPAARRRCVGTTRWRLARWRRPAGARSPSPRRHPGAPTQSSL